MCKAAGTIRRTRKGGKKCCQVIYHYIVSQCIVTGYGQNLWALSVSISCYTLRESTDLVRYAIVHQYLCKCFHKVYSCVGICDLNHIKQQTNRRPILLEMYCDSHICSVVWRRSGVSSETQCPFMFLVRLLERVNF